MVRLPNGVEIPDEDIYIWAAYNNRCVVHPDTWAICLHEEPPRSKNPHWRQMPETRFPVCNTCHFLVHSMSRSNASSFLNEYRSKHFPHVEKFMKLYAKS